MLCYIMLCWKCQHNQISISSGTHRKQRRKVAARHGLPANARRSFLTDQDDKRIFLLFIRQQLFLTATNASTSFKNVVEFGRRRRPTNFITCILLLKLLFLNVKMWEKYAPVPNFNRSFRPNHHKQLGLAKLLRHYRSIAGKCVWFEHVNVSPFGYI